MQLKPRTLIVTLVLALIVAATIHYAAIQAEGMRVAAGESGVHIVLE